MAKETYYRGTPKPYTVYFLRLTGKGEEFYKIGVTEFLKRRISKIRQSGYKIELLKTIELPPFDAIELESKLHGLHKKYSYTPVVKFGGYLECYKQTKLDFKL